MSNSTNSNKCRLIVMFSLTFGFFLVEIIVGYMSNSMALVADSFHMLSDVAALIVAFLSVKMSPKKWSKNTFGWARAEVLGALVNSVFLVALCFSILVESVKRFIHPENIDRALLVLIVGAIGLLVNIVGLVMFGHHGGSGHSHGEPTIQHQSRLTRMVTTTSENEEEEKIPEKNENEVTTASSENNLQAVPPPPPPKAKTAKENPAATSVTVTMPPPENNIPNPQAPPKKKPHSASQMNIRGVFLHIIADALGSVVVIISALIILYTDWEYSAYIDPSLSVFMTILIMMSVWPLLQESALILLQNVPTHIQIDELKNKLLREVDGVLALHEFHIWQLTGDKIIATAHIRCRSLKDYVRCAEKVKEFFHNEGIHSTTIQAEFDDENQSENLQECFLVCPDPTEFGCGHNTCCGPQPSRTTIASAQSTTGVPRASKAKSNHTIAGSNHKQ